MRRKRAHRMRVLEMPEDDLHVRIPVPIGKTVYRVHQNPACHYGVRAAERAVFGRVITPRYVVTPVPFAVEMMREWNRTVFARVLDAERKLRKKVTNLVIVGMPGAGKSSLGRLAARDLDMPLVDLDEEIVRAASQTIPHIFEAEGEAGFRRREAEALRQAAL